jgi:hypothetical protein
MTTAVAKKPTAADYKNPLAINVHKPAEQKKVKVKLVQFPRDTQVRDDNTPGHVVDVHRAEEMADALRAGKKLPPVKLMTVSDMPGHKDEPMYVMWDGFHTHAAHELAKLHEIDALIWHGTWAQALAAAATYANAEHATNGKPKSYKDKIRSLHIYAKALEKGGVPKKEWPSNREAAVMFGVSHTAVGDEDPFGRRQEGAKTREQKLEEKKRQRQLAASGSPVGQGDSPVKAPTPKYEVVQKSTGAVVATVEAETPAKALEAYKSKKPEANLVEYVTREVKPDAKAGSETVVKFDWSGMDNSLGYVIRGTDAMGDLFEGAKKDPALKVLKDALNNAATMMTELKKKYGTKASGK